MNAKFLQSGIQGNFRVRVRLLGVGIHRREVVFAVAFDPKGRNACLQSNFATACVNQNLHVSHSDCPAPVRGRANHKQRCDSDAVAPS